MKIKESLDLLFKDISFDSKLINAIERFNIRYILSNKEIKDFMGGRLIGCFYVSYMQRDKEYFYDDLFRLDYKTEVLKAIKDITTIPSSFKVARDDINMICFYIAHRFLSNKELKKEERDQGARAILDYFGYRTLVLISHQYWIYPITKDKAQSVLEVLSGNYLITSLKNWNAYVKYRSQNYLDNAKAYTLITKFEPDKDIPNLIVGLLNGHKSTVKSIYEEFINLDETNFIRSSKNVVKDNEGRMILLDKLSSPTMYANKVKDALIVKNTFVRRTLVEASTSIVTAVSQEQLDTCLGLVVDYAASSPKNFKEVGKFVEDFMADVIAYLQSDRINLSEDSNVVEVVSKITGNLLYARGTDISITAIKERGEKLIETAYKKGKTSIGNRLLLAQRNAFCVYLLLLALT